MLIQIQFFKFVNVNSNIMRYRSENSNLVNDHDEWINFDCSKVVKKMWGNATLFRAHTYIHITYISIKCISYFVSICVWDGNCSKLQFVMSDKIRNLLKLDFSTLRLWLVDAFSMKSSKLVTWFIKFIFIYIFWSWFYVLCNFKNRVAVLDYEWMWVLKWVSAITFSALAYHTMLH